MGGIDLDQAKPAMRRFDTEQRAIRRWRRQESKRITSALKGLLCDAASQ
jgi:hypothetical protein